MTVIRPNSVSGITSITAQANEINFFRSNGTLAGLQLNGVNFNTTTGVSTFNNLDVGGVLTYQDVTNVDSVGIITARSTIDAQGDVSIADKIVHTGDTNTAIRFPSADTFSVETAGNEAFRIKSNGQVDIASNNYNSGHADTKLRVGTESGSNQATAVIGTADQDIPALIITNWDGNATTNKNVIRFDNSGRGTYEIGGVGGTNAFAITVDNSEKFRIASDGEATFAATNINVNRNAGDAFISLQTSGTSNVALYGGASSGFRVFTKPSGGSLTERVRIKNDGKIKFATSDSTTDYLEWGSNPRLWLRCPSNMNGMRIDASTTPLEIKNSNNNGKSFSFDGNFNFNVNGDYSLSSGQYDSSGKIFLNATRHNGSTTVTSFQTSIQAVATSNANNTGYLGLGASASPDDFKIYTSGIVTKPNQPSFLVAPANDAATINGYVTYTTVYHNTGTHYSTSNGRFTAPVTGYYTFFANYVGHAGSNNVFVRFYINGNYNHRGQHYSGTGRATNPYMSCDTTATHTLLQANDYVQLHLTCSGHDRGQAGYMRFCGYLVH